MTGLEPYLRKIYKLEQERDRFLRERDKAEAALWDIANGAPLSGRVRAQTYFSEKKTK